jgi:L-lactate dehydrogenase complex protein LldF
MKAMAVTLASPTAYNMAGKTARWVLKHAPFAVNNSLNPWYKHRDMPEVPEMSFKEWYSVNRKSNK